MKQGVLPRLPISVSKNLGQTSFAMVFVSAKFGEERKVQMHF